MISRAVSRCCSEDVMASKTLIIGARAGVTRGGSHIVTPSRGMALQSSSRFGRQDSGLKCDGRRWHTKGLAPAATPVAAPVTAAQTAATVNTSAVFFTAGAYLAAWLLLRAVSFSNQRALKRTQEEASSPSSTVEGIMQAISSRASLLALSVDALIRPMEILLLVNAILKGVCALNFWIEAMIASGKLPLATSARQMALNAKGVLVAVESVANPVTAIAFASCAAWVVLRLKAKLVSLLLGKGGAVDQVWSRAIIPISGLMTWLVVGAVGLFSLQQVGVDVTPLLTVGGVSGVVLGFAAQGPLTNLLCGLQLYVAQPFLVGDKVELRTASGSKIVSGFVERIEPLRTYITSDEFVAVSIPNKLVLDTLVAVSSKPTVSEFATRKWSRKVTAKVELKPDAMEKVPGFVSALKTWLEARDDVDKVLPKGVTWSGISGGVLTIDVMCHTTKEAGTSSGAGALRTALFLEIGRAVQELGAEFVEPVA